MHLASLILFFLELHFLFWCDDIPLYAFILGLTGSCLVY